MIDLIKRPSMPISAAGLCLKDNLLQGAQLRLREARIPHSKAKVPGPWLSMWAICTNLRICHEYNSSRRNDDCRLHDLTEEHVASSIDIFFPLTAISNLFAARLAQSCCDGKPDDEVNKSASAHVLQWSLVCKKAKKLQAECKTMAHLARE